MFPSLRVCPVAPDDIEASFAADLGLLPGGRSVADDDSRFHVALPIDAMTDLDAATHDNSIALIFPKPGETGTTAEVLAHLCE